MTPATSSQNVNGLAPHLPRQAICLAPLVPKVAHLTVFDVHPCLSHVALSLSVAILVVVDDDLRHSANVGPPIVFVFVDGVGGGIPGKYLRIRKKGGERVPLQLLVEFAFERRTLSRKLELH